MDARRGARLGWTWGWIGGSVWMLAAAGAWLRRGDAAYGLAAAALFAASVTLAFALAPARRPYTRIWKLFLPLAVLNVGAAALFLVREGGWGAFRSQGILFAQLIAVMGLSLLTLGRQRYADGAPPSPPQPADRAPLGGPEDLHADPA